MFRAIFSHTTPAEGDASWEKTREEFAARFPRLGPSEVLFLRRQAAYHTMDHAWAMQDNDRTEKGTP